MKRVTYVAAFATLFSLSSWADANIVDDFTQPAGTTQIVQIGGLGVGDTENQVGDYPASILGGYRDLKIEATGTTDTKRSALFVENGSLTFVNDPGVNGSGWIQWDGDDSADPGTLDPTGLQGISLVDQSGCPNGGCDRFVFDLSYDRNNSFDLTIYTTATSYTTVTVSMLTDPAFGNNDTEKGFELPFAIWTDEPVGGTGSTNASYVTWEVKDIAGTGADVTNVGALQLALNACCTGGTTALDMDIAAIIKDGEFNQNPAPATLALLGFGLAGISAVRRRKGRA